MSMTNDLCERAPLRVAAKQIALSVAAKRPAFSGFYSKKRWRITIRSVRAGSLTRRFRKNRKKRRKIISLAEKNCYFESQFPGAKTELPESFTGPIVRLRLLKGETEHDGERLDGISRHRLGDPRHRLSRSILHHRLFGSGPLLSDRRRL